MLIGRPVATIVLSSAEKEKLKLIANRPKSNQRDALRARMILEASEGLSNTEIARRERVCLPALARITTDAIRRGSFKVGIVGFQPIDLCLVQRH
jgi:hypothetical protein